MRENDDRLTVEVQDGDPPTIALLGEVDPHTAPILADALNALVDGGATSIRIEADRLDFIDSSGLRVLVEAHRRLGNDERSLTLVGVSPTLRRLLEVTGLDEHVTIESTTP